MPRRCVSLLSLAGALALAAPAAAQDVAAAEALFNRGLEDMKAGRFETGCRAIAQSHGLDPRPGTLFTLATCEERWGHVASAATRYGDYLALFERLPDERKAAQGERPRLAREHRAQLGPEVPELTLLLPPGAPAGTTVLRDGQVMASAALGVGLPVDPGEHTLTTQVPGGQAWEQTLTIARGDRKTVTVEVRPTPRDAPLPPPAASTPATPATPGRAGPSGRRVAAFVTGGIGLAALALGGVMGGLTLAGKGTIDQHCGSGVRSPDPGACDAIGLDAANRARTFGLASTVGFAVGAAGVGTAIVLFTTSPRPAAGTGARGRWLSVGALSVGPGGAVAGARGAW